MLSDEIDINLYGFKSNDSYPQQSLLLRSYL